MKKQIYIAIAILMSLTVQSQANKDNADKKYDQFAYIEAIKTYERIATKGYRSVELFQKIGNSYYFNAELEKANQWYSKLFALKKPIEAEYYFRYSQTLKAVGKLEKANEMLQIFHQKNAINIANHQTDKRNHQFDKA